MDAFVLRMLLSFVVGGTTVALFTTLAERSGPRLGGLLLSFPVKVTVSLVLIALNEGLAFASESAVAVPAGIGVNAVFLVATALLARRFAPWPALAGALALWAIAGLAVVLWLPAGLAWSLAAWALVALVGLALLARVPGLRRERRAPDAKPLVWWRLALRGVAAGSVVAGSLVVAHYGGPLLGGLASVFPSGFLTSMVILTRKHGPDYTAATVRVMVVGTAAPALFGAAIAYAYPRAGVLVGTLACLALAGSVSLALGWLLRREAASQDDVPAPA